ncbi:MAG: hypothetical protein LRZ99_01505 [Desulfotomaculum sp.]|nr:hypothetical protein [Desulfotomaculum sp.]MCL0081113.1 hypothetical protein [Peptococcaceae bacterium]
MLKVGDRLQLWPKDTYPKYGVVKKITRREVTVEITGVDIRDFTRYQPGHQITFPWSHFHVVCDADESER